MNAIEILRAASRSVPNEDYVQFMAAVDVVESALIRAHGFIDGIREELHNRRVADWFPEGAHNAAEQMSEDMRLIGNACADFDTSFPIANVGGAA